MAIIIIMTTAATRIYGSVALMTASSAGVADAFRPEVDGEVASVDEICPRPVINRPLRRSAKVSRRSLFGGEACRDAFNLPVDICVTAVRVGNAWHAMICEWL